MSRDKHLFEDELPRRDGGVAKAARSTGRSRGSGVRHWAGTPSQRLRVALGMRQAVLKITSYRSGPRNVYKQLLYISRYGKLALEAEDGLTLEGQADLKALLNLWRERFDTRVRSRDTMHMVLSAPEGTDQDKLKDAVREFAHETFADNHNYVFVRHDDCKHPHLHLLVLMRGRNGEKLDPRKYDLARWRETFAEKAREQGIQLDASPRYARGKGKKGERQNLRHMRGRGVELETFAKAAQEVVREGRAKSYAPNQFEEAQSATNKRERAEYAALARKYERLSQNIADPAEQKLAASLAQTFSAYEKSMPIPESLRQQMLRASAAQALISPDGAPKGAQKPGPAPLARGSSAGEDKGPER